MNLISCSNCGVVLDKDKLNFPNIHDGEGVTEGAVWCDSAENFSSFIYCPVCKEHILEEEV